MNDFFWASGHLAWGIFSLIVFTILWVCLADLYWRLKSIGIVRLVVTMAAGWIIGVVLIFLFFYIANR